MSAPAYPSAVRPVSSAGHVLTVAGATARAASELRALADLVARGTPPKNLSALLLRYARCCEAAVVELRTPVCRPGADHRPGPTRGRR